MNTPILNRSSSGAFEHPKDGWYQIEAKGSHPNRRAGLVQIVDDESAASIVNRFNADASAGKLRHGNELLIDHEHFKEQDSQETRAYGWLQKLENRKDGIYADIRWTATGKAAVDGGDYRFFSTEYDPADLEVLNDGKKGARRARPMRLDGLSLTNMNNNRGQKPITNRDDEKILNGDVVGHEFHGNQHTDAASGASSKADEASAKAEKEGTPEAHKYAADAHFKAAEAHRRDGDETTNQDSFRESTQKAKEHFDKGTEHQFKARKIDSTPAAKEGGEEVSLSDKAHESTKKAISESTVEAHEAAHAAHRAAGLDALRNKGPDMLSKSNHHFDEARKHDIEAKKLAAIEGVHNRSQSPGQSGDNNNTENMKDIAKLLGLPEDSAKEAVLAGITKINNRAIALEGEQVDSLLAAHKITDENIVNRLKPVLLGMSNREDRETFLAECVTAPAKGAQVKLFNRDGKGPQGAAATDDEAAVAQKITNRAAELKTPHRTFDSCWQQAKRELTPVK